MEAVFDASEVQEVLEDRFYSGPRPAQREGREASKRPAPRGGTRKCAPETEAEELSYKVICISLYKEDLARLDAMVAELKANGHRKMSRSALIRYALDTADLDGLPRAY